MKEEKMGERGGRRERERGGRGGGRERELVRNDSEGYGRGLRLEFDTVRDRRCLATFKGGNPHWRRACIPDDKFMRHYYASCLPFSAAKGTWKGRVNEPVGCDRLGMNTTNSNGYPV